MASARLQRWAITHGAYNYKIVYKPGKEIGHSDGLSHLPLPDIPTEVLLPGETILLMENLQLTPVNTKQINTWTDHDPVLSRVHQFILQGWPSVSEDVFIPYERRKHELSIQDSCILWGYRVVIPPAGTEAILDFIHEGHSGISKMKSRARSFMWWPNMDKEITRHSPPLAPLDPWDWPQCPGICTCIHVDYTGPFLGKMYLIVVDAHSKWMEIAIVNSATTTATIEKMRSMLATYGLPEILVYIR